jgi:hypothetical protein
MGVNLLADRLLSATHHTDYLPLLKRNVNIVTARNIRSRTICRSWIPGLAAAITRDLGFILDKGMKTPLEQIIVTDRRH